MTTQRLSSAFDAEGRRGQMFPKLTREQVARVSAFGEQKSYPDGAILFEQGDRDVPFFVVLEGELEIVHPHNAVEHLIVVHGANEFTGEVSMLADRRSLVRGRAKGPARVIRVENTRFRELLQTDSEISEVLVRAFILRRLGLLSGGHGDVVLVGSQHSAATLHLQEFLVRNGHPYQYVDVDRDTDVEQLLHESKVEATDIPILICADRHVLKHPTDAEVAECLDLNPVFPKDTVHDVVVCGAGPAGLAAAVYAASEGLKALVVETGSPGGQAASSSKIENYLGFPTGISGQALTGRALAQAEKFGAKLAVARGATRLHCSGTGLVVIDLANGESVQSRAVVIATGAEYRKLDVPELARFEGVGVYYAATFVEAQRCTREDVIVVGGGNSAGQAATFLAQSCRRVHMLVRGPDLAATMSRYLIRRIEETPNIELRVRTRIVGLHGATDLERVTWRDDATGEESTHNTRHVFTMAGATPNTGWLRDCVALDEKGFVCTDTSLTDEELARAKWSLARKPYLFETSHPRIFAVGDVRANSVKRVASAVGEGSVCIQLVHKALME
jgi:thioredoxin reductase (NADPH)